MTSDDIDLRVAHGLIGTGTAAAPTSQTFSVSGTWVKPANAKHVLVQMWGGGGGGGAGSVSAGNGAGGGGAGYREILLDATTLTGTVAVTVGASGTAGVFSNPTGRDGGTGGTSSFGSYLSCPGGGGGPGGSYISGGGQTTSRGSGGDNQPTTWNSTYGYTVPSIALPYAGAAGETSNEPLLGAVWGGGGGANGTNPTGSGALTGGTSTYGGAGGNGAFSASIAAQAGAVPGGGGGGGANSNGTYVSTNKYAGAKGGAGQVIVTTYYA